MVDHIAVVGPTGAGKSTMASRLAKTLCLAHIELDALFHLSNWEQAGDAEFQASIQAAMAEADRTHGGWTMCGEYNTKVDHIRSPAANTIVWLDLPRSIVMVRVVKRTIKRAITRQELWNGNREATSNMLSLDRDRNIVLWAWSVHPKRRAENERRSKDGTWAHAEVVRLQNRGEVRRWLAEVETWTSE